MKKIVALLSLIILSFSSCEKDDICIDETTPRLIVEFYDISNPANLKDVLNLKVQAVGVDKPIVANAALPETDVNRYLFNGSKLQLPLRIDANSTKYSFILNSTSTTNINEDFLEFNYDHQNVFVSRACGYKTTFTLNNSPNGVILSDAAIPDGLWMAQQNINVTTTTIVTENETHIKIYF